MKKLKRLLGFLLTPISAGLSHLVAATLPLHGKRVMFITSVYFALSKETYPGPKTLKRLNASLKLAANESAMEMPARLSKLLWEGRLIEIQDQIRIAEVIGNQDSQQVELFSTILVDSTPHWMRYGRRTDMLRDVRHVIEKASEDVNGRLRARGLLPT